MKKKRHGWLIAGVISVIVLVVAAGGFYAHHVAVQRQQQRQQQNAQISATRFIKTIAPAAQREQKRTGIPASIIIAQAGLESEWGRSSLAQKYHNLFGVKAMDKKHRVRLMTTEYLNGKKKHVKVYFATYDSWADSIDAHTRLLLAGTTDNPHRYQNVTKAKNYKEAARDLQQDGYATDPDYANKLINAIQKFNLQKYDK